MQNIACIPLRDDAYERKHHGVQSDDWRHEWRSVLFIYVVEVEQTRSASSVVLSVLQVANLNIVVDKKFGGADGLHRKCVAASSAA